MSTVQYVPTQLVSFLFINLVAHANESTTCEQKLKTALISRLNTALEPLPRACYRVRDTGDGAVVAFLSVPEQPLYVALALWRACSETGDAGSLSFQRLRIGVNIGTVKEVPDLEGRANFVGDGINSAKRAQSLAKPGQILASRNFFDALAHLDMDYSRLFTPTGAGDDKHHRPDELYDLHFEQAAFDKLTYEMQQGQAPVVEPTTPPTSPLKAAMGQMVDLVRLWFVPVNIVGAFVTLYVNAIGKITEQSSGLTRTGLVLLLFSLIMGLFSFGLQTKKGQAMTVKFPRLAGFFHHRALILLMMILGIVFLVLSKLMTQPEKPTSVVATPIPVTVSPSINPSSSAPSGPDVANTGSTKGMTSPSPFVTEAWNKPAPAPVQPTINPLGLAPVVTSATPSVSEIKPYQKNSAVSGQVMQKPATRAKSEMVTPKADTFNSRCSHLLEKVGSGEPLSAVEQNEMVSKCR